MAGDEHFLPVGGQILDALMIDPSWDVPQFPTLQSHPASSRIGDGPFLHILEEPKQRGFRFRYGCEGPSHGGLPGASSEKNKKTYPTVKICNYQGPARVVVQLVTALTPLPRLHAHSLVGKQCDKGICILDVPPKDDSITFPNLGIQHVTKKNVAKTLEERMCEAVRMGYNFGVSIHPEVDTPRADINVPRQLSEQQRGAICGASCAQAKEMDLSVVRLMFTAFLPDSDGGFTRPLHPVLSHPIYDSKAPNASNLKIVRMDRTAGCVSGGEEVYLLCDKVQKDDIQVRFFEEDDSGVTWEALGDFSPTDVHRQFAIVFKTPKYHDQNLQKPTQVFVQLKRKSDSETSEPKPFTYHPQILDKEEVQRKRQKTLPNFQDFSGLGGGGGGGGGGGLYRGGPGAGGEPGSAGGGYFHGLSAFNYGRGAGGGACPTGYATGLEGGGVKHENTPGYDDDTDSDSDDDSAACTVALPPRQQDVQQEDEDEDIDRQASAVFLYAATGDAAYLLAGQHPLLAAQDDEGDTGLHLAVLHGQQGALDSLTRVLAVRPPGDRIVDMRNHLYQTPLHLAVTTQQPSAAQALLAAGADPTLGDRHGDTPLHLAARQGGAMVRLLLGHHAVRWSVDTCNAAGLCAIHLSVASNQLRSLRELLEGGADVEAQERSSGRTALHLATEADNVSLAGCLLLEGNAKVDCCTFDGSTPLHVAAGRGSVKLTALLMAAGADPHRENLEPLFYKDDDDDDDEGCVPGTSPINLAASEQVLELLSGSEYRPKCPSVVLPPQGDLQSLDASVKTRLCNAVMSEALWERLADALGLGILKAAFRLSSDPVKTLVDSYEVSGGTVRDLEAALRSVGSGKALSVLEEALCYQDDKRDPTTGGDDMMCAQLENLKVDGVCDSGVELSVA
ncbi:nuclear factor NF-kappa-B p105 subunit [Syngnathus acus]|uniref:nuclear factor NF-kappa-B p105 subunit n=1 Tax=Syngnathus acus TaxID=161584 RepID=UPI0018861657|nr:nuclear factor NF-kappa-B p105 subunit [Syngnathus acus]XP_037118526.1 nuclear factor NF-kappa-B p105 subunit [Syngnathus acus]XP_037118528.1 nuclear factor NF-kappa-B p105 subunit [Syngnathus acus]